ncbi:MAG: 2Fe-2S iron-sulfur cluster-binding protein [Desulfobacterales bacterium]|nr:2Fe-2S iron-sulfur cluster-binding protein [Desulfobacterales bacterium]
MMVSLEINGHRVEAAEGTTILNAARQAGIDIPTFCYREKMEPYGGCRLCMVEVTENNFTRLQPSCAFPVKENLIVKTSTKQLIMGRRVIIELLLARCPEVSALKNLAESFGITRSRFTKDNKDCVLCGQCVRVCQKAAKVGAIDFVGRGRNRRVSTPFDLPSEACIGCGSCAYVCPTGAMKMEYENVLRWRKLPGPLRKCRYMRMGYISHKICPNNYACWNCEVDQQREDIAKTHPVFLLKDEREREREKVEKFEMLFDRFYGKGHVWVKRINGLVRVGIDDFTRQLISRITDIKIPPADTTVKAQDPLWLISANARTLHMYAPLGGKVVDINPGILENPSLISMDPYGRGWILTIEPDDILQASRQLLSGRSAKEWLKLDSHKLYDMIQKETNLDWATDKPIPDDLTGMLTKDTWAKIDKAFFLQK